MEVRWRTGPGVPSPSSRSFWWPSRTGPSRNPRHPRGARRGRLESTSAPAPVGGEQGRLPPPPPRADALFPLPGLRRAPRFPRRSERNHRPDPHPRGQAPLRPRRDPSPGSPTAGRTPAGLAHRRESDLPFRIPRTPRPRGDRHRRRDGSGGPGRRGGPGPLDRDPSAATGRWSSSTMAAGSPPTMPTSAGFRVEVDDVVEAGDVSRRGGPVRERPRRPPPL